MHAALMILEQSASYTLSQSYNNYNIQSEVTVILHEYNMHSDRTQL